MENDFAPSLEASLLQRWFPVPRTDRTPAAQIERFSETDLRDISDVLRRLGRGTWSRVPRIYVVLRRLDRLDVIDLFIAQDISDVYFPFTLQTLPQSLIPSVAHEFLQTQRVVLSSALDLERETGRHRHFSSTNDVPFIKVEELGKGAYGYVDRVSSTISHKEYARKLIPRGRTFQRNQTVLREFERELGTLKKLCQHRHIIRLIGSYTDPRYVGILMSPVADCDLKEFLSSCGSKEVSIAQSRKSFARSFFGCLTSALSYLHDNTIRHKDIKPQNVLVSQHTVYLTDFGISLDWSEIGKETTTGPTPKTARYCAPEVSDYAPRNTSSDMWSLGCIMLEIWTVLKGETVENLYAFLEAHGTLSSCYHLNQGSVTSWIDDIQGKPTSADNAPLQWIRHLLVHDGRERWTARQLFVEIETVNNDPETKFAFCGQCCMDEFEGTESVISTNGSFDNFEETQETPHISALSSNHLSASTFDEDHRPITPSQSSATTRSPGPEASADVASISKTLEIGGGHITPSEGNAITPDKINISLQNELVHTGGDRRSVEEPLQTTGRPHSTSLAIPPSLAPNPESSVVRGNVFSAPDAGTLNLAAPASQDVFSTPENAGDPPILHEQSPVIEEGGSASRKPDRGLEQDEAGAPVVPLVPVSSSTLDNMHEQLGPHSVHLSPMSSEAKSEVALPSDVSNGTMPMDSPTDRIAILEKTMNDLSARRIEVESRLEVLNKTERSNPLTTDFNTARLAERRKRVLMDELSEIKREEHDIGFRLHRAYKKRDNGSRNLWVRRDFESTESRDVHQVVAAAVGQEQEQAFEIRDESAVSTGTYDGPTKEGGPHQANSDDLAPQRRFSFETGESQSPTHDLDLTLVSQPFALQPVHTPPGSAGIEPPSTETPPPDPIAGAGVNQRRCGLCKEPLTGQFVRSLSNVFHLKCFTCVDCGNIVASKFFPLPGEIVDGRHVVLSTPHAGHTQEVPLCETDFFRRLDLLCHACGRALRGSYITALDRKYHIEHFVCTATGCDILFGAEDSYFEHDGQVLCERHYKDCAAICHGCGTWILKNFVQDQGKSWHPECYNIKFHWDIRYKNEFADSIIKRQAPLDSGEVVSEAAVQASVDFTMKLSTMTSSVMTAFEESCAASIIHMLRNMESKRSEALAACAHLVLKIEMFFEALEVFTSSQDEWRARHKRQNTYQHRMLSLELKLFFGLLKSGYSPLSEEVRPLFYKGSGIARYLKEVMTRGAQEAASLNSMGRRTDILHFLTKVEKATTGDIRQRLQVENYLEREAEICALCNRHITHEPSQGFYWTHAQVYHVECFACPSCNEPPALVLKQDALPSVACTHCSFGNMMNFITGNLGDKFVIIHSKLLLTAHLLWTAWSRIACEMNPNLSFAAVLRTLPDLGANDGPAHSSSPLDGIDFASHVRALDNILIEAFPEQAGHELERDIGVAIGGSEPLRVPSDDAITLEDASNSKATSRRSAWFRWKR